MRLFSRASIFLNWKKSLSGNGGYDKPGVAPKLVPQTQRDKVEGVKGAAAL